MNDRLLRDLLDCKHTTLAKSQCPTCGARWVVDHWEMPSLVVAAYAEGLPPDIGKMRRLARWRVRLRFPLTEMLVDLHGETDNTRTFIDSDMPRFIENKPEPIGYSLLATRVEVETLPDREPLAAIFASLYQMRIALNQRKLLLNAPIRHYVGTLALSCPIPIDPVKDQPTLSLYENNSHLPISLRDLDNVTVDLTVELFGEACT